LKIAGRESINNAKAFKEWVEEGPARHQEATQTLFKKMKNITDRVAAATLLQVPHVYSTLNLANDSDARLALALAVQFLSLQLHHATPNVENLEHVITPSSIQPALAEILPINPIKTVSEYSNQIPSTLSLSFNTNHQLISSNWNNTPWVETKEPYIGEKSIYNSDSVLKFYSVTDSKGKPLELSELGAPFLDVTTNPLNNLLNERNGDFLYNSDHHYPNTERKIKLPEQIIITIVDSHTDKKTGEIIKTPSKRGYILTLKESAVTQAQQGRDTTHPTVPGLHAKALK
jgi:hypothetical protein